MTLFNVDLQEVNLSLQNNMSSMKSAADNIHFSQNDDIIHSTSSSSSIYSHGKNGFYNENNGLNTSLNVDISSPSYSSQSMLRNLLDLTSTASTSFSAFDTLSNNLRAEESNPDLNSDSSFNHSFFDKDMPANILEKNSDSNMSSPTNGDQSSDKKSLADSESPKTSVEVAMSDGNRIGGSAENSGRLSGDSQQHGTNDVEHFGEGHMISAAEMNAMEVSALNSMMSIVIPHNKGNSNMKRNWRNVGWFTSEEEMNEVRKRQRVSKWKSVDQINGLKVFFRCNKWKRTNCNYRMYVMYYAMDRISLNESGEHDHSTPNEEYKPRIYTKPHSTGGARAVFEATPSSSQQRMLDQFILSATAQSSPLLNGSYEHENVFDTKYYESENLQNTRSTPSRPVNESADNHTDGPYHLSDGQNIAELLQVAADMDLTFTFNSRRTCEYCFESNVPEMKGKMVVFSDHGNKVSITERNNGVDQGGEEWKKADWKQFLWAVRGKCMNALKGI